VARSNLGLQKLNLSGGFNLTDFAGSGDQHPRLLPEHAGRVGRDYHWRIVYRSDDGRTEISLDAPGTVAEGTYILLDWSSGTASGVSMADFTLTSLPPGPGPGFASHHSRRE